MPIYNAPSALGENISNYYWLIISLTIIYLLPVIPATPTIVIFMMEHFGLSGTTPSHLFELTKKMVAIVALLIIIPNCERRSFRSVGLYSPTLADVPVAVGAFVALVVSAHISHYIPPFLRIVGVAATSGGKGSVTSEIDSLTWYPYLNSVVLAPVLEGIGTGYTIERLAESSGSVILAAGVAFLLDALSHVPLWGCPGLIFIAPWSLIFVAVYTWKRRVFPLLLAHAMFNGLRPLWIPILIYFQR